jgi:hypothetical protein
MKIGLKFLSTMFSLLIIAVIASLIFLITNLSNKSRIDNFAVDIFCILILVLSIFSGLVSLILRFINILKSGNNFFFNFIGTLNFSLGVLGIILLFFNYLTDKFSIALFFLSLLLGVFILIDFFRSKIPTS